MVHGSEGFIPPPPLSGPTTKKTRIVLCFFVFWRLLADPLSFFCKFIKNIFVYNVCLEKGSAVCLQRNKKIVYIVSQPADQLIQTLFEGRSVPNFYLFILLVVPVVLPRASS